MPLLAWLRNCLSRSPAPGVCEGCGAPFHCGMQLRGCWCSEVRLDDAQRATLRGRFRGCLCRVCLEKAAGCAALGKENA
jgi:hypothetical protein